jgi:hypothetical protein
VEALERSEPLLRPGIFAGRVKSMATGIAAVNQQVTSA